MEKKLLKSGETALISTVKKDRDEKNNDFEVISKGSTSIKNAGPEGEKRHINKGLAWILSAAPVSLLAACGGGGGTDGASASGSTSSTGAAGSTQVPTVPVAGPSAPMDSAPTAPSIPAVPTVPVADPGTVAPSVPIAPPVVPVGTAPAVPPVSVDPGAVGAIPIPVVPSPVVPPVVPTVPIVPVVATPPVMGPPPDRFPAPVISASNLVLDTDRKAARFLSHAAISYTLRDIESVKGRQIKDILIEQYRLGPSFSAALWFEIREAQIMTGDRTKRAKPEQAVETFWKYANEAQKPDWLRLRVVFALSQMLVVSLNNPSLSANPQMVAHYFDVLLKGAFGSYKDLLMNVSLSPAMGHFLTHIKNQKENPEKSTMPDQNYAREIMQLFTIGLRVLNPDGTDAQMGETYSNTDVEGLSRVFTGFSFAGPDKNSQRFFEGFGYKDLYRYTQSMQGYPQFHSTSEKRFLGTVIAQGSADPMVDLQTALSSLCSHPNTAVFVAKNMIIRLISSNPDPGYVARVAAKFKESNLSLSVLWTAIFTDPWVHLDEHLRANAPGSTSGRAPCKMIDPIVRFSRVLKATGFSSASGVYDLGPTEDASFGLGQAPFKAPSVFNFTRPGYTPAGSQLAMRGLVAPEMQLHNEVSAVGYVNFVYHFLSVRSGDLTPSFSELLEFSKTASVLLEKVEILVCGGRQAAPTQRNAILRAIDEVKVHDEDSPSHQDYAKKQRIRIAVLLVAASTQSAISW